VQSEKKKAIKNNMIMGAFLLRKNQAAPGSAFASLLRNASRPAYPLPALYSLISFISDSPRNHMNRRRGVAISL
ncbi:MAG: hypothetical protein IJP90_00705, partial [Treponema sp.]|nr:hypothetical protein [Treponema sp.]